MKTFVKIIFVVLIAITIIGGIMAAEAEYLYEKENKRTVHIYDDPFKDEPEIVGEMPTIIHSCRLWTGEEPVYTNDWWRYDCDTNQWIVCH